MYEDHYGLSERPFQLTPDPRFWFESRTHRTAMAYLGYGLAQGEGFIVITGDVGSGKTTLVGHLMASVDRNRFQMLKLVSTQVDADDMLRLVAQDLGLGVDGLAKAQLLERIERTLRLQANQGRRTLLIVDEAQNLPTATLEELRMLSNFQNGGQSLLQIFLLGQPEFRDRVDDGAGLEQLRQRIIATHHLTGMEADEVKPYVLHRLERAGWQGRPAFGDDAWAALHRHSDGVPRRLNLLAGRLLLHGAVEGIERFDASTVDLVAGDMTAERATIDRPLSGADAVRVVREQDPELIERLAAAEERLDEQEAAMRRLLTLLLDWIGSDEAAVKTRKTAH